MPTERRRGAIFGLLDSPLYGDWIAYLWGLGLLASFTNIVNSYQDASSSLSPEAELVAVLVDICLAIGVQTFIFMYVPASIRRLMRRRSAERLPGSAPSTSVPPNLTDARAAAPAAPPPPGWQPDPWKRHDFRWWDGHRWTDHVSTRGLTGTDAVPPS